MNLKSSHRETVRAAEAQKRGTLAWVPGKVLGWKHPADTGHGEQA